MEQALLAAGLSVKEAHMYMLLLTRGGQTAAQLATASGEKRTNVYALLESLADKQVIEQDDTKAVRKYVPADPACLQKLLQNQQASYQQAVAALRASMPQLKSQFALVTNKPGVIYMAGTDGLLRLLDDMVHSPTEVLLVASDMADVEGLPGFKQRLLRRKDSGVVTRAIAHDHDRDRRRAMYASRGMELRFLGEMPYTGEVVVYGDNVAFTVYEPSIITTVITNPHISQTMRTMFEGLWAQAG